MAEMIQGFAPIFPHEDIQRFRAHAAEGGADFVYELRHLAGFLTMQALGVMNPKVRAHAAALANGEVGAEIFADKFQFGAFVNDLGYTAPRSVVVEPGVRAAEYFDEVAALDTERPQRFSKPLRGTRGKGTRVSDTTDDALAFATTQGETYLVQTYEQPELDWRYILHRDTVQLANGEAPGWRIAFQKIRPTVTGDGSTSIRHLIAAHPHMPKLSRDNYAKSYPEQLTVVPAEGEVVNLVQAGNVSQGAYTRIPSAEELRSMDAFMGRFLNDAEAKLNTRLGTLVVDLGVRDTGKLVDSDTGHEAQRRNVVFYEHQMPFGVLYDDFPADKVWWGRADKRAPWAFPRRYVEGKIYVNFVRSVLRSGQYLRRHAALQV